MILEQTAARLSTVPEGRTGFGVTVGGTLSPVSLSMPLPRRPMAAEGARFFLSI